MDRRGRHNICSDVSKCFFETGEPAFQYKPMNGRLVMVKFGMPCRSTFNLSSCNSYIENTCDMKTTPLRINSLAKPLFNLLRGHSTA